MKKVVQLALLIAIISTATTHCWEWSSLVPNRLQNWYQNWQIRKQEIADFKALQKNSPLYGGYTPTEYWTMFRNEEAKRYKRLLAEGNYDQAYYDEFLKHGVKRAEKNLRILEKYKYSPQANLRSKYFSKENINRVLPQTSIKAFKKLEKSGLGYE